MKSNKTLAIVGLVATFLACFAGGFFIPVDGLINGKSKADAAAEAAAQKAKSDSLAALASAAQAKEIAAADKINNTPVIEPCQPIRMKKFGYNLSVTASVPSGDSLLFYVLCEVGSTEPKYKSTSGYIGSRQSPIVPSESGSYDLIVTNTRTGDSATLTVKGFNKVNKLSASELQTSLNAVSNPLDFDSHMVEAENQKIEFENLPEGIEDLNNVGALKSARGANGWTLEVVPGSIKYDRYNRIQSFKIKIIE